VYQYTYAHDSPIKPRAAVCKLFVTARPISVSVNASHTIRSTSPALNDRKPSYKGAATERISSPSETTRSALSWLAVVDPARTPTRFSFLRSRSINCCIEVMEALTNHKGTSGA